MNLKPFRSMDWQVRTPVTSGVNQTENSTNKKTIPTVRYGGGSEKNNSLLLCNQETSLRKHEFCFLPRNAKGGEINHNWFIQQNILQFINSLVKVRT